MSYNMTVNNYELGIVSIKGIFFAAYKNQIQFNNNEIVKNNNKWKI